MVTPKKNPIEQIQFYSVGRLKRNSLSERTVFDEHHSALCTDTAFSNTSHHPTYKNFELSFKPLLIFTYCLSIQSVHVLAKQRILCLVQRGKKEIHQTLSLSFTLEIDASFCYDLTVFIAWRQCQWNEKDFLWTQSDWVCWPIQSMLRHVHINESFSMSNLCLHH